MAVRERLALPGLDDQVVETGLLGAEVPAREARLLRVGDAVLDRHVLDVAEVGLRVAHRRSLKGARTLRGRDRCDIRPVMAGNLDSGPRRAGAGDADAIGALLHDFNTEFEDYTPGPRALADRVRELLAGDDFEVLLAGPGPDGLAVLRFRPSIWTDGLECYLAELYVAPARRRQGLGLALMEAAVGLARLRGADYMDLGTSEADVAARGLYERLGFRNREGGPEGPVMYFYERDL
jgi:ribosomal protein S18 acetylase RimI-like enzyme